jgi:hypothetical protein
MHFEISERLVTNPILRPQDLRPSVPELEIVCLLNPGVFRFQIPRQDLAGGSGR